MPLQKSFSEQNGPKPRQLWQRSKTHTGMNTSSTSSTRPVSKRPLEPVSEITKNKLHAFKFQPPALDTGDGRTLEDALADGNTRSTATAKHSENQSEHTQSLDATNTKSAITPIGRLAWQDLIGVSQPKDEEERISPNERIGWNTRPDAYRLSPMVPRRRGKKRARSSSPTSSPASGSKSNTPAVNVQKLSQALKSPHADPAMELWDRFSVNGSMAKTPLGTTNPALAQIMFSSSPKPSKASAGMVGAPSEGGLRRAISCGVHWPKRRRVERSESSAVSDAISEDSPCEGSKSSMVNALLQSVTGEINRSKALKVRQAALKSPSPKKKRLRTGEDNPPTKTQPASSKPPPPLFHARTNLTKEDVSKETTEDGSDYEDDDFDDDALMELDATLVAACEDEAPLPAPVDMGPTRSVKRAPSPTSEHTLEDDEFADLDDDDVFAAAEDMVAQIESSYASRVDSGSATRQELVKPQIVPGTKLWELDDDAFGDDFGGDFDFEAAEIAATQSVKEISATLAPVRRCG
ncbi:uncharacterized protein BCR38DRAFT_244262 [Pseudomassariella vexata]|uniref:Uncharacterized protein n=1 Tax=Pseudomassariella vexata TaxID=1141098 RepID=A0A1Y2DTP9_9PEZI|nr:uncharacterized protein BCR38DRAFT_244262 [Pseudomassariella vexata]ORY62630.1 hypothetical protein BCR38DRAFT_244262 [Pseudomassariella vexata]